MVGNLKVNNLPESLEEKYQLIFEKVKSLEEENNFLAERADESLLLRKIAEAVSAADTEEILLDNVLEKISIIKKISFCGCYEISNGGLKHIDHYVNFADSPAKDLSIKLSTDVIVELQNGPYLLVNLPDKTAVKFKKLPKRFKPFAVVFIPFSTRTHPTGLFVFIDDDRSESKLSSMIIILQNIIQMIEDRLDKISLLDELTTINTALENRIEKRTRELRIKNQKLQNEILERKKVLTALSESEEKYRLLFNAEHEANVIIDFKTKKIVDVNTAAIKLYGYSKKEFLTMSALDLSADPEKSAKHIKDMGKFKKHSISFLHNKHRKKDGTVFPVEVSAGNFEYRDQNMIYAVFRDISERVKAEDTLRKSEQKFKQLVSDLPDAIFLTRISDKNPGEIIDVNQAAIEQTGYSRDELIGMNMVNDLVAGSDDDLVVRSREADLKKGGTIQFTETKRRKDGTEYITEVIITTVNLIDQSVALSVNRDVTQQKETEDQLRKLYQSVEQSQVSVVITDVEGNIEYVNPKFTQVTGYTYHEVRGENPRILKSGFRSKEEYKELWDTITAGHEWQGEFQNKRKNGELYWEHASISPIKSESGEITHFLAVKEDITERKRLQQQLIQAQKMESIGNLAGGIAHDFNNLLTVINGHAEISLIKLEKEHPAHRDMISILHAGKRAENLTRQLLAFSRKQIYESKIINLNKVITGLDKLLRRLIGENIKIKTKLENNLPLIKADPGQIEQILMNLIVNARDAINELGDTEDQKIISIETGSEIIVENMLKKYPAMNTGEKIFISIHDTGIGIPTDLKDKIFEPFFTTKEKGKGTGLGLSTVYGIVKQNQGFIYVDSEEKAGTTFKIYWPVSKQKMNQEIKKIMDKKSLEGYESILFVEDDEAVRDLICGALRELGYHVLDAGNGKEALEIFEKNNQQIDLLVTDMIMPEMNGKELVTKIQELNQDFSVIYTSGYTDDHIVTEGELKEGLNFVAKPYSISDIAGKIRAILDTSPA